MDTTIDVLLRAAEFIEQNEQLPKNINSSFSDGFHSNCSSLSSSLSSCSYLSSSFQPVHQQQQQEKPPKIILRKINHGRNQHHSGDHVRIINNDSLVNDLSKTSLFKFKNINISSSPISGQARSNKYEEFHETPQQQQQRHHFKFGSVSPINISNDVNSDSSTTIDKSPIHIYSTSPSSFSCSSSSSSLFSLSNMGYLGGGHEKTTNIDDECDMMMDEDDEVDVDGYADTDKSSKPEDVKRNKMIHNILEKNRRAHLKDCFENLQYELPQYREKKVTNLLILKQTIKYLEQAKRSEMEYEAELKRLLNDRNLLLEKLEKLKNEQQKKC